MAAVAAMTDWVAVGRRLRRLEYVTKPLTLALLVVAARFADLGPPKPFVITALLLGLLGDIALVFAEEGRPAQDAPADVAFHIGLGFFLFGHIAYVIAFTRHGLHPIQLLAGALVVSGAVVLAIPKVLRGAEQQGGRTLAVLVGCYAVLLGAMVVLGFGTAAVLTAAGVLLFLLSDLTLAWGRFVQALQRGAVIVVVTYHLAQVLIVVGLIR